MMRCLRRLFRTMLTSPIVPPKPKPTPARRTRLGVHPLEDRVTPSVVPGNPDFLFNGNGRLTDDDAAADDRGAAVAVQADGKIVVVGSVQGSGNSYDWGLWRYNPNGTPDNTFDGNGYLQLDFSADGGSSLRAEALAVAIQSDGKIVVGGYSSTATNGEDQTVVRLTTTGGFDTTFDGDGIWTRSSRLAGEDEISSLAIQSDGKIVAVGYFTSSGSGTNTNMSVVRLTATGGVEFDYGVAFDLGGGNTDKAAGVAIQSDGKIVVVGSVTTTSYGQDMAVVRLNSTGAYDSTFDGDGKLTIRFDTATGNNPDLASAVAIQSDGKIVVGGTGRTAAAAKPNFAVVRLTTTGGFDTTFDTDGKQTVAVIPNEYSFANAMALQPDGKIVLAGYAFPSSNPLDTDAALARFTSTGAIDTTFAGGGSDTYPFDLGGNSGDQLLGVALDASGRVVAVGSADTTSAGTDMTVLRVFGQDIPLTVQTAADEADGRVDGANLSLREAIVLANTSFNADTITLAESLNGATITLGGKRMVVQTAMTINGPSQGATLDGNLASQVFYFNGRSFGTFSATLRNLTVTRGKTLGGEGVIDGYNSGDRGGGILNDKANLTLENVTVLGNVGTVSGGGIYNTGYATSLLTLRSSLLAGNSVTGGGGGGGIFNEAGGTVTAINTTFSGNTSAVSGGGIYLGGGTITLVNVTATLNVATGGTGGFLLTNSATATVHNSIISGNLSGASTPNEINGTLAAASSNNVILNAATAGGLTNGTNGNQTGVSPLLGALLDNGGRTKTHAPGQNSPAIGKASAAVANYSVYDQRGTARDVGTPDVGAFEVQHPLSTVGAPTTLALLYTPKPSASTNEAFIKGLYRSTLLREATAADVAAWLPYIAQGRAVVANGFVNSIENRDNQVRFFFRYFLGRDSDYSGIAYWRDRLRGGTPETEVIRGFILSPEFTAANNNAQFVNVMYYSMLGRQADTAGFNYWVGQLNAGAYDRGAVSDSFLRSPEGIRRVVKSQFETYLKHSVSDAGADGFQTFTFGQTAVFLLSSEEFYVNAANNMT